MFRLTYCSIRREKKLFSAILAWDNITWMRLFKSIFHQECCQKKNYAFGHWPKRGEGVLAKSQILLITNLGYYWTGEGGSKVHVPKYTFYFDGNPNVTLLLLSVHRNEEILSCAKTLIIRYFLRLNLVVILKSWGRTQKLSFISI